jgi:type VI secretion system protein ImpE
MNARDLFQAGKLDEAVQAVGAELRNDPTDVRRRTFLFELLCFSGEYDRAEKQLDILADSSHEAGVGSLVYRAALHAERLRREMFQKKTFPGGGDGVSTPGNINGAPFESIEDGDPRIGDRLEVFAAGVYLWLPFEHISSVEIQPPKRLRDLIWIPALLKTGPACKGMELGEVLLPVLTPFAWKHPDSSVRLGRTTNWEEEDGEVFPVGQKMLIVDGEEMPILDVRKLEFVPSPAVVA